MQVDALAVGKLLASDTPTEVRKKAVMDFFRRTHKKFNADTISYGAIVLLPNDDVRVLGGRDQTMLEFYIKHAMPDHLAAEIIELRSIQ